MDNELNKDRIMKTLISQDRETNEDNKNSSYIDCFF